MITPSLSRPGNPTPGGPYPSPQPSGPKPPPTPPPTNDELLDVIDAQLVALLALAAFGPAEKRTAASVRQVCAAEVLLFRLRTSRKAVAELRAAYGPESPARRDPEVSPGASAIATTGGPVHLRPVARGEEPAPGSAVALRPAARESTGVVAGAGAGSGRGGKGAVERAPRPVMPNTRVPLRFPPERLFPGAPTGTTPGDGGEPPTIPRPIPPKVGVGLRTCGGKSLHDGVPAGCGALFPHRPHALDREPVLSRTP